MGTGGPPPTIPHQQPFHCKTAGMQAHTCVHAAPPPPTPTQPTQTPAYNVDMQPKTHTHTHAHTCLYVASTLSLGMKGSSLGGGTPFRTDARS